MSESPVRQVIVGLCQACIDGVGHECHTPGCILWLHTVDVPIHEDLLQALAPAMTWTRKKPVKAGWYWFRDSECIRFMTVVLNKSTLSGDVLWGTGMNEKGSMSSARVERWDGQWAGPLAPPLEPPQ